MVIQQQQIKYVNFCGIALQYTLINGIFWLNATQLLNLFLKISIVQINKLKENEKDFATLDGTSAVQVFVPFSVLSSTVQKILVGKAEKLPYFDEVMENGGGIEKLNQMLHHSNNMVFHTVESLLKDLDTVNERANSFENLLADSDKFVTEYKQLYDAQTVDHLACAAEKDAAIVERDDLQHKFTKQSEVLNGLVSTIAEHVETIETKKCEIEGFMNEHNSTIEQLKNDHETEKAKIVKDNEENATKVAEENAATIEKINVDHKKVLQPLLERSNLRKFWLGRDASLYAQIALQLVCMAFMFPLINKHYPFESLPTWLGVIFQVMLTAMLPIASILFSLRKRKGWLWGIFVFEVLFSNSQTELFNPYLGNNIHLIENTAVTFFLPLLLVAFGTLTSERETNKALLITPKE